MLKVHIPYEAKYQLLINRCENISLKHSNDLKALIGYSNDMNDIYETFDECNPKTQNIDLFDDIIVDIHSYKNLLPVVTRVIYQKKNFVIFYYALLLSSINKHKLNQTRTQNK